jgi:hypothetical protein
MAEKDWNEKFKRARRIINILGIIIGVGFIAAALIIYFA